MVTLKELSVLIVDCEHKTAPTQDTGYPSIRTPNIGRGRLLLDGVNRVSEETYKLWTKREEPRPGDLILAREAPIGNVAIVPPGLKVCLGQRTVLIRPDKNKVNPQYLTYLLLGDELQEQILSKSNGATVHHLNMSDIRSLEISSLPNRTAQDRIAAILSAYDDLIENNTRRIKILEQMAQMLYREWFVNFRFPGHEKVKMVESEMGLIPEGWEIRPLGSIAVVTMGLSPKGDTYNELGDGLPLINGPVEFGEKFAKAVKWTTAPTKLCKEGDLIVCVRGSTTGRYVKSDAIYCLGRGVCALSSQHQCFIDLLFQDQLTNLLAKTSGSTFPSWTGPQLKSHLVLCPPAGALDRFEIVVKPLNEAILVLSRKIKNLRQTRDLLLPKLVSGEISVENLEREVVAEMV